MSRRPGHPQATPQAKARPRSLGTDHPSAAKPPPPSTLSLRNRQNCKQIHLGSFRRLTRLLLLELLPRRPFELCLHLVGLPEITRLNEAFLAHVGPTDVITFDHGAGEQIDRIYGEIFLCVQMAVTQARQFRTSWQAEVVRYLVHGLLHLHGYNDRTPTERRRMKVEEDRLCRSLSKRFPLSKLECGTKVQS